MKTGTLYTLINPTTNEIFYVGATTNTLKERLHHHYCAMYEAKSETGKRKMNTRLQYLLDLMPLKAIIQEVGVYPIEELYQKEAELILDLKLKGVTLTNQAKGGIGGATMRYATDEANFEYRKKLSEANIGRPKPEGFAEHLSNIRKGLGNPATKPFSWGTILAIESNGTITEFNYGFEINAFMGGNKSTSQYIGAHFNTKDKCVSKGITFIKKSVYEQMNNNTKDIV